MLKHMCICMELDNLINEKYNVTYFKSRTLCFLAIITPLLGPESLNMLAAVTQKGVSTLPHFSLAFSKHYI